MTRSPYRICAHVYILTAETRIFMLFWRTFWSPSRRAVEI